MKKTTVTFRASNLIFDHSTWKSKGTYHLISGESPCTIVTIKQSCQKIEWRTLGLYNDWLGKTIWPLFFQNVQYKNYHVPLMSLFKLSKKKNKQIESLSIFNFKKSNFAVRGYIKSIVHHSDTHFMIARSLIVIIHTYSRANAPLNVL